MTDLAQGNEGFVVDDAGVVPDGANELSDAKFAGGIKRRAVRSFCRVLNLGAVIDGSVAARRMLGLAGIGMVKLGAQFGDIVFHREAAGALGVVPDQIDAYIQVALLVDCDLVVFAEGIEEVVGMAFAHVLDPEIVNY